jgi:hypothetical protein
VRRPHMAALVGAALIVSAAPGSAAHAAGVTARVDNPWYPLLPGMSWQYEGTSEGKPMSDVVEIPGRVQRIDGVPCAVVRDRVYVDGVLSERTTDWYSQDRGGNVMYYGEATAELDANGHVTSTEGSWRAGRNGARAGVFMPARPPVGRSFAQEHDPGTAEDLFRVVSLHATIKVPFGTYTRRALMTREWTPLEPGVRDAKWYVRGIGQVAEKTLKGGSESLELVSFKGP